jgi:hypothetical protein
VADVVVSESEAPDVGTAELSAHAAAVAEGASAVQAGQAAEAAEEAKAAAEVALSAAQANVEAGLAVEQATASAEASAQQATVSAEMVMEALSAQGAAIAALAEELKASRKQPAPPASKGRGRSPDREPGSSGPRLVRR